MEYDWHENNTRDGSQKLPPKLKHLLVSPASKTYQADEHGEMLLQRLSTDHFDIWFNYFHILKDRWLKGYTIRPIVTLHFMLQGFIKGSSAAFEQKDLNEGIYNIFYVPSQTTFPIWFAKGEYHSVRIDLQAGFLEGMKQSFPQIHRLITSLEQQSSVGVQLPDGHVNFRVKTILNEIQTVDTDKVGSNLFLHARVYELLWVYLEEISHIDDEFTARAHFKKIQQVYQYISLNLDSEMGTSFLARHFGISATTLKRQFKFQYGVTIREFLLQQRMETAKELLVHTDLPIHSIGAKVGYPEFSSFTLAFTRYYGNPPTHFRK